MDEQTRLRREACTEFLNSDGPVSPPAQLASIGSDVIPDIYGDGGVVADLEQYVAELLGKPASVFLPSGTMAQGATLRVHADARGQRMVLWHPYCHLERNEEQAHARLHGVLGRPVGGADRLITLADLAEVSEPIAALLLELPQRDLGGQLPSWSDLLAQLDWARSRGGAVHLDGARLWEAAAGYQRSPAEVAEPFDSVYVSFYKGIGALPGCCVAGSQDLVSQVRQWRRRLGGTLFGLWPAAASALNLLPERLAEMPARLAYARAIATALSAVAGVRAIPDPPQTPMMHLLFEVSPQRFAANARRLAEESGLWVWPEATPTADPDVQRCELSVGRATCRLEPAAIADALQSLVA